MPIKHLTFFALAVFVLVPCKKNSGTNSSGNDTTTEGYVYNGTSLTTLFTYDNGDVSTKTYIYE